MEYLILTKKYGEIKIQIDEDNKYFLQSQKWYVIKAKTGDFYILNKNREYLHRLLVNASKGLQVHHKNHNTLDNRKDNLEVFSPKEHAQKSLETRKLKLSDSDIKNIIESKEKNIKIAQKYNITSTLVSNIKNGKHYISFCPECARKEYLPKSRKRLKIQQEIKYLVQAGINLKILSAKYNISLSNLYEIRKGTRYKNVEAKLSA